MRFKPRRKQSRLPFVLCLIGVLLIFLQIAEISYFNSQDKQAAVQQRKDVYSAIKADGIQIYLPKHLVSIYTGQNGRTLFIRHPVNQQTGRNFYEIDDYNGSYIETKISDTQLTSCDLLNMGDNTLGFYPCSMVETIQNGTRIYVWQAAGGTFYFVQAGSSLLSMPTDFKLTNAENLAGSLQAIPVSAFNPVSR